MASPTIRKASLADLEILMKLGTRTFIETFARENTEEDMRIYLDKNFNEHVLASQLNNLESEFYLILVDKKEAGYMKLNVGSAQTELRDLAALEVERIYIINELHGNGLGKALLDCAYMRALQSRCTYMWLGVWEHNTQAIAFYEKNGFTIFDKHVFLLGNDRQIDLMMRRPVSGDT